MATVICPNCGGENNVTKRGGQECEYCGTMLQYPQAKKKTEKKKTNSNDDIFPHGEFIIELSDEYSTEEKVSDALRTFLLNSDNVPLDIFDHLTVKQVNWFYLPMIRYSGRVETEWSCNQVIEKEREIGERPIRDRNGNIIRYETEYETYYDYIPKSGRGNGSFDVLIPCGKGVKLSQGIEECYGRISFSRISSRSKKEWPCKEVVPVNAKVNTDFVDLNDNKSEIIGEVARVVKDVAAGCSFGNFGRITDEDMTYRHNLNLNTGLLYFVPFVQVIYSYKGDTHEWVFMQSPSIRTAEPTIPEMDENENPLIELQNQFEKQRKRISKKELWSYVISFFIPPLLGFFYFDMFIDNICKKAKRRLNTQFDLATLLFRLKRSKGLPKHGKKAEISKEGIEDLFDEEAGYYDGVEDALLYDGGEKPTTIEGIEAYFAETEIIYRKAIKRINGYWWRVLAIILLLGGAISGYLYYDNWQSEKMQKEEAAAFEIENRRVEQERRRVEQEWRRVEQEWHDKFQAEFIGKEMSGTTDYYGMPTKRMQIKIIDASHLEYSIAEEDYSNIGLISDSFKTILSKTVPYTIRVTRSSSNDYGGPKEGDISVKIEFDGYVSKNLLGESHHLSNHKFADKFEVAEASKIDDVVSKGYNIVRE